jgi:type II secretory pathway component PulM
MKQWFRALSARERVYVIVGAGLLVIYGFWQIVWQPIVSQYTTLNKSRLANQELVQWMQISSQKVIQLQGKNGRKKQPNASPIGVAEMLIKKYALNSKKPKMNPKGDKGVQVSLKGVMFDQFMRFLDDFEQDYGFICISSSITPTATQGEVNVRFTVVRN